jgi:hypothetical protein
MDWFKRHRLISSILVFFLITLPSTVSAYTDLWDKFKLTNVSFISFWWWRILIPFLGIVLAITIILLGQKGSTHSIKITTQSPRKTRRLNHDGVQWEESRNHWGNWVAIGPLCPKDSTPLVIKRGNNHISITQYEEHSRISESVPLLCLECNGEYTLGTSSKTIEQSRNEVETRFEGMRNRDKKD